MLRFSAGICQRESSQVTWRFDQKEPVYDRSIHLRTHHFTQELGLHDRWNKLQANSAETVSSAEDGFRWSSSPVAFLSVEKFTLWLELCCSYMIMYVCRPRSRLLFASITMRDRRLMLDLMASCGRRMLIKSKTPPWFRVYADLGCRWQMPICLEIRPVTQSLYSSLTTPLRCIPSMIVMFPMLGGLLSVKPKSVVPSYCLLTSVLLQALWPGWYDSSGA